MTATNRIAGVADAAALAELAAATFALACPPHTTAAAVAVFLRDHLAERNFDEFLADPTKLILVAERDTAEGDTAGGPTLLGYTLLIFGEPSDTDAQDAISIRPSVELSKCYFRAETHGDGISAPLLTATLDAARSRGAAGAWLGVNQVNGRAIRFYEKSGFRQVGMKRFRVGDDYEDDFVLERAL